MGDSVVIFISGISQSTRLNRLWNDHFQGQGRVWGWWTLHRGNPPRVLGRLFLIVCMENRLAATRFSESDSSVCSRIESIGSAPREVDPRSIPTQFWRIESSPTGGTLPRNCRPWIAAVTRVVREWCVMNGMRCRVPFFFAVDRRPFWTGRAN